MSSQRFDDLRMVDPVLTTISQGYVNDVFLAEKLFPIITVSKSKGRIPIFGRDAFFDRETERAARANSNRIKPTEFTLKEYVTRERDVEMSLDYLETEEVSRYYKYEQKVTRDLKDILNLSREKEIADELQNENNYREDMRTVFTDANNFSNGADPFSVIENAREKVRSSIGKYPNTIIMGSKAYKSIINSMQVQDQILRAQIQYFTMNMFKEQIGMDTLHIGYSVFAGEDEVMTDIWQDNIILAYVDKSDINSRSEYNPSFGYILQKEGMPEVDTYNENGGKIKVIRCTDNFCWQITAPDAGYLIKNCYTQE